VTRRDAPPPGAWVRCDASGKRGYYARADAKRARRQTLGYAAEAGALTVYRCEKCDQYHVGHMSKATRRGDAPRPGATKPEDS